MEQEGPSEIDSAQEAEQEPSLPLATVASDLLSFSPFVMARWAPIYDYDHDLQSDLELVHLDRFRNCDDVGICRQRILEVYQHHQSIVGKHVTVEMTMAFIDTHVSSAAGTSRAVVSMQAFVLGIYKLCLVIQAIETYQACDRFVQALFPLPAFDSFMCEHMSPLVTLEYMHGSLWELKERLAVYGAQAEQDRRREMKMLEPEWDACVKVWKCAHCHFYFPAYLNPRCPKCSRTDNKIELCSCTGESKDVYLGRLLAQRISDDKLQLDGTPEARCEKDLAKLEAELANRLSIADFPGIGNAILEAVMAPENEKSPNGIASWLFQAVPSIVAKKYSIPELLTYECPHRDVYLPSNLRGRWETDGLPHLVIMAYVLGATWKSLPGKHGQLSCYYEKMAQLTANGIQAAAQQFARRPVAHESVKKELSSLIELGLDPQSIADQLLGMLVTHRNPTPSNPTPLTPEDFQ